MAPALAVYDDRSTENQKTGALGKTTSGKQLRIRSYPKFSTLEEERVYRKQHLAAAFRVFADRGFDEGVAGHISVRDPILTNHFCTSLLARLRYVCIRAVCYTVSHGKANQNLAQTFRAQPTVDALLTNTRLGPHPRQRGG
jgi:hypothetical protein